MGVIPTYQTYQLTMNGEHDIRVEVVTEADDITRCFDIAAATFGVQTDDAIWQAWNPGWDTPEGKVEAVSRMRHQLTGTTKNQEGKENTIFVKATVPNPEQGAIIAGYAVAVQASVVPGCGDPPVTDFVKAFDLDTLYPGNTTEQKYICQFAQSLLGPRNESIVKAASRSPPAILCVDIVSVDPAFQGRGIGSKLVQWLLDEAVGRGGLDLVLEASVAGKSMYKRLGFMQEGPNIVYHVDEEFKDRQIPTNVFMRARR